MKVSYYINIVGNFGKNLNMHAYHSDYQILNFANTHAPQMSAISPNWMLAMQFPCYHQTDKKSTWIDCDYIYLYDVVYAGQPSPGHTHSWE